MRISDWSSDVCSSDLESQTASTRESMLDQSLSSVNPISAGTESASESGKRAFAFPPFNAPQTSPTNMTHFRNAHPHLFLQHPLTSDASKINQTLTSKRRNFFGSSVILLLRYIINNNIYSLGKKP